MNMSLLQNLLMGFLSGITELLPVSAEAHRKIFRTLLGIESEDAVFRLLIHVGCLIAVLIANKEQIHHLKRTRYLMRTPPKRRKIQPDSQSVYTIRLLRSATFCMVFLKLFTLQALPIQEKLNLIAIPLLVNGIFLIAPALFRSGNKDSRNMPRLDGILMGCGAGLSVFPGISAIGASLSLGIARGTDKRFALNFSYLLLIRVLIVDLFFDLVTITIGGAAAFSGLGFFFAILGALAAGFSSTLAIHIMNFMAEGNGFTCFSYYSWSIGLFSFVLFLTV